ncbi:hypothetical protein AB0284_17920 [Pseudarthrobacter phenanthrenivorans]|uniref:hypothetical protein n=1 Tax=Pseudarthrobacter phenanthrenivorans TaxID=361575 RepID=UPI00344C1D44
MKGEGTPIAYTALRKGTPVVSGSGRRFGAVDRVIDDASGSILHGIIVRTRQGRRFVARDSIIRMTTTEVECSVRDEEVADLPAMGRPGPRFVPRLPRANKAR